jgi:hypothetical protein
VNYIYIHHFAFSVILNITIIQHQGPSGDIGWRSTLQPAFDLAPFAGSQTKPPQLRSFFTDPVSCIQRPRSCLNYLELKNVTFKEMCFASTDGSIKAQTAVFTDFP